MAVSNIERILAENRRLIERLQNKSESKINEARRFKNEEIETYIEIQNTLAYGGGQRMKVYDFKINNKGLYFIWHDDNEDMFNIQRIDTEGVIGSMPSDEAANLEEAKKILKRI